MVRRNYYGGEGFESQNDANAGPLEDGVGIPDTFKANVDGGVEEDVSAEDNDNSGAEEVAEDAGAEGAGEVAEDAGDAVDDVDAVGKSNDMFGQKMRDPVLPQPFKLPEPKVDEPKVDEPKVEPFKLPDPFAKVDEPEDKTFVPHIPMLPAGPLLIDDFKEDIETKYDVKPFKSITKRRVRRVSRSTRLRKSIVKEENKINRSKKRIDTLKRKLSQQLKKDKKHKPKPKLSKKQKKKLQKQIKSLKKRLSKKGGERCVENK